MVGSSTLVFSEPEDFETALRAEGCLGLWITGRGQFRARLTRVALRPGSLIVNSSQGGGSKDTWVLE